MKYAMQFKGDWADWTHFDAGAKWYSLPQAIDRVRTCFFTGKHDVCIIRQDGDRIDCGRPTTSELLRWLAVFANNEEQG